METQALSVCIILAGSGGGWEGTSSFCSGVVMVGCLAVRTKLESCFVIFCCFEACVSRDS